MRKFSIYTIALGLLAGVGFSCADMLNEQPRSSLTNDYLWSEQGIDNVLVACYSGLRFLYGTEGSMTCMNVGTDEATYGGDGGAQQTNDYGAAITANGTGPYWDNCFTYINMCNGIIKYAAADELDREDLLPEAHFLRAHYYFLLVKTYGGVPLDLGSGRLEYNTKVTMQSVRDSAIDVYQAIVDDLEIAVAGLGPRTTSGKANQAAALHYLAKAYLCMANYYQYDYTNELGGPNPGSASQYYTLALQTANRLLENRGAYGAGLLSDFALVNQPKNEDNSEVLFMIEHTSDYTFDESGPANSGQAPDNGYKENRSNFMMTPYYEEHGQYQNGNKPLVRTREYGRGWRRFVPTVYLLDVVYADKINDTRYYKTWQSVWRVNAESKIGTINDNGQEAQLGDIAIYMPGYYQGQAPAVIQARIDEVLADGGRIWYPNEYTRNMFPTNMKFLDPETAGVDLNDSSHRPYLVAKLSETILIAAEAALMTGADASVYINELRQRAVVGNEFEDETTAAAAMTVSAGDIDIDFILDERSRELCNEELRWFDLARTGKLVERISNGLNRYFDGWDDNAAANIKDFHSLRPIPQTQIDRMTGADKYDYQNPGYN